MRTWNVEKYGILVFRSKQKMTEIVFISLEKRMRRKIEKKPQRFVETDFTF